MISADTFIKKIAKEAGDAVWKRFGKDGAEYMKSKNRIDVVTKADVLSEKIIISGIRKHFPHHGIIAEESGTMNGDAEYVWIIDPIDGTLNFSLGIPLFGVMIALTHKRKVILSAIYVPYNKELFFSKAGKGAYLNGKKIHCTPVRSLDHSFGCGSATLRGRYARFLQNLLGAIKDRDALYAAAGSMAVNASNVASGRRDWMVALFGGVHDFAPISLLLKESGCVVTNAKGKPWTLDDLEIVAANPYLHKHLIKLTKNA